jgi:hypothetical protein
MQSCLGVKSHGKERSAADFGPAGVQNHLWPAGRKQLFEAEENFEQLINGVRVILRNV